MGVFSVIFQIQNSRMSLKRTFGLVGDYGCGSSSEDEEEIAEKKKVKQPVEDPKDSIESEDDHIDSEKNNPSEATVSAKWKGVRKEYEDSSLMFKCIQDTEKEDAAEALKGSSDDCLKIVEGKKNEVNAEKAASDALAAADAVKTALDDPEAKAKYFKAVYEEKLKEEQAKKALEEATRDWEIKEIQREIEDERKKWDAVWSDDEGEGAESEAVLKDQDRRGNVLQAVINEVKKANKKPEEEEVKVYAKKGEGWKRLQIIAESRVKNDPEKYITYPTHKFPLRDQ